MSLYYLDSVIVIYAVEGQPADQQRALAHIATLEQSGHEFAISDLTRTEFLVQVLAPGAGQRLSNFFNFLHVSNLRTISLTSAMFERAGAIRGGQRYAAGSSNPARRYTLPDALHLAAAIESGCDVYLTNDSRLVNFPDITIEVLP